MHSVKSSLKSQLSIDVSIKKLSMLITKETMSNHIDHTPSIQENTVANLRKGLYDYIERKIYKSWYGDIVPTITANSLYTNLIVIEKHEYGFRCYCVGKNASNPSCLPLLVFKCGEHYDGLVLSRDREYRCPGIDHVMRVTACNDYNAVVCSLHDVTDHLNSIDTPAGGRSQQLTFETKNCAGLAEYPPGAASADAPSQNHQINMISWNINGLTNDKLHDNMLGSFFKKFDLILLTETWTNKNSDVELQDYTFHNYPRKYKHANAKRDSGGIGLCT